MISLRQIVCAGAAILLMASCVERAAAEDGFPFGTEMTLEGGMENVSAGRRKPLGPTSAEAHEPAGQASDAAIRGALHGRSRRRERSFHPRTPTRWRSI